MEVVTNYCEADSVPSQQEAFNDIQNKYSALPRYDNVFGTFLLNLPNNTNISDLEEELNEFGIEIIEVLEKIKKGE